MTWLRNPITLGVVALLAVILLASTVAIVPETKQVVVVQFENPIGTVNRWKPGEALGQTGAGLMARIPLVDRLIWIDKRVLDLDLDNQPVLSTDQQRLEVDAFARFRIVDPLRLVQSMGLTSGTEDRVRAQLTPLFASALRSELGKVDFNALLSPERGQLMDNIQIALQRYARNYGVQIIDVRIKHVDQPDQIGRYIFAQIDAEAIRPLAASIDRPLLYLKVCAPADAVRPLLPTGWEIAAPGYMPVWSKCGTALGFINAAAA